MISVPLVNSEVAEANNLLIDCPRSVNPPKEESQSRNTLSPVENGYVDIALSVPFQEFGWRGKRGRGSSITVAV